LRGSDARSAAVRPTSVRDPESAFASYGNRVRGGFVAGCHQMGQPHIKRFTVFG